MLVWHQPESGQTEFRSSSGGPGDTEQVQYFTFVSAYDDIGIGIYNGDVGVYVDGANVYDVQHNWANPAKPADLR